MIPRESVGGALGHVERELTPQKHHYGGTVGGQKVPWADQGGRTTGLRDRTGQGRPGPGARNGRADPRTELIRLDKMYKMYTLYSRCILYSLYNSVSP